MKLFLFKADAEFYATDMLHAVTRLKEYFHQMCVVASVPEKEIKRLRLENLFTAGAVSIKEAGPDVDDVIMRLFDTGVIDGVRRDLSEVRRKLKLLEAAGVLDIAVEIMLKPK